jgi:hypothetical protein
MEVGVYFIEVGDGWEDGTLEMKVKVCVRLLMIE